MSELTTYVMMLPDKSRVIVSSLTPKAAQEALDLSDSDFESKVKVSKNRNEIKQSRPSPNIPYRREGSRGAPWGVFSPQVYEATK